jgi:hypothetical protein
LIPFAADASINALGLISAQQFRANGSTRLLVRGKDASLGHFVDHQINEPKWEAWKVLPEAVRTGQVAFALAHDGLDMHQVRTAPACAYRACGRTHHDLTGDIAVGDTHWLCAFTSDEERCWVQYDEVNGNEAFADDFQKVLTRAGPQPYPSVPGPAPREPLSDVAPHPPVRRRARCVPISPLCAGHDVLYEAEPGGEVPLEAAYDWSRARCIMDVGGGRGEMLSRCMAAAGREVRGVLMDRQWVLDR